VPGEDDGTEEPTAKSDDPTQVEGTPERDEQQALMAMQSWDDV